MNGFKFTYCSSCNTNTAHDIYISANNYLHSLCAECGKDVASNARMGYDNGSATKDCSHCSRVTEHIRYVSENSYIHWFCCSCGKDISSNSRI